MHLSLRSRFGVLFEPLKWNLSNTLRRFLLCETTARLGNAHRAAQQSAVDALLWCTALLSWLV